MAWITPTIAAVGALGSAAIAASRSNAQQGQQADISNAALQEAANNRYQQSLIQALINQRSIAGTQDSAGTTMRYDPATNQWISQLGPLPQQAQTSADQAAISRNTTDLRQAQFANENAAVRAARAQPYADTTRRNLEDYRPMGSDQLIGLLQQQGTIANNNTFAPLVADTLRQFARTGTSAGPVLGQIGKDAATNLRSSLIDAQVKGMSSVDSLNQGRRQGLEGAATTAQSLATPAFGYSGISPSSYSNTMAQLAGQRASGAATAPAYGAGAVNAGETTLQGAYGKAAAAVPDPNTALNAAASGLKDFNTAFGAGGSGKALVDALTKRNTADDAGFAAAAKGINATMGGGAIPWAQPIPEDGRVF
jgi:hypothetical protein